MLTDLFRALLNRVREGGDVLDGGPVAELLRRRAAIRLGADLVAGMALCDVCDYLLADPENDG